MSEEAPDWDQINRKVGPLLERAMLAGWIVESRLDVSGLGIRYTDEGSTRMAMLRRLLDELGLQTMGADELECLRAFVLLFPAEENPGRDDRLPEGR